MSIEIKVPTLGESVVDATIARWLKKPGEAVGVDEPVVELETDKVTLEVPSPVAGVLTDQMASEGETVEVGAILAHLEEGAVAAPAKTAPAEKAPAVAETPKAVAAEEPKAAAPVAAKAATPAPAASSAAASLSPAVRRLVTENNLDPQKIAGTGKEGRLTKGDVQQAIAAGTAKASSAAAPASAAPAGPVAPRKDDAREQRVPMSRLRRVIASRLKEAQNTAAMLTTFNEVDMSAVMALRTDYKEEFEKIYGARLGFLGFFVKAVINALTEFPAVNAEIHGTDIIYKNFYNIGVAVGTPQGLVVPVLRDAQDMSLADIEMGVAAFGQRARDGKLSPSDLSGGSFTISNGGVYGSMMSTPILNTPQSGILGMHKIQKRPVAIGNSVEIRPMMYLALSYDHRVIDGREAVSFLVRIKESIEDPRRLLLGV